LCFIHTPSVLSSPLNTSLNLVYPSCVWPAPRSSPIKLHSNYIFGILCSFILLASPKHLSLHGCLVGYRLMRSDRISMTFQRYLLPSSSA
jgi:hypothetical protein